jgi:uncharacterized membrane protein YdbT with pleckstrin-like domain
MAYPSRLLLDGERVVLELHPHGKRLVVPVLALLLVLAATGYLLAVAGDGRLQVVVAAFAALLVGRFSLVPFLRWRGTLFVVTDRRVVLRSGVLSRSGRDVLLSRINDITFSHSLVERLLGCGTLVVDAAGERGEVVLTAVPGVEQVQRTVHGLAARALP